MVGSQAAHLAVPTLTILTPCPGGLGCLHSRNTVGTDLQGRVAKFLRLDVPQFLGFPLVPSTSFIPWHLALTGLAGDMPRKQRRS